jgi:hypothetical protein
MFRRMALKSHIFGLDVNSVIADGAHRKLSCAAVSVGAQAILDIILVIRLRRFLGRLLEYEAARRSMMKSR